MGFELIINTLGIIKSEVTFENFCKIFKASELKVTIRWRSRIVQLRRSALLSILEKSWVKIECRKFTPKFRVTLCHCLEIYLDISKLFRKQSIFQDFECQNFHNFRYILRLDNFISNSCHTLKTP